MLHIKSQGAAATALPVPAIPLHKSFATVLFAPAPSPERVLVAAKGGDHGHTPAQQTSKTDSESSTPRSASTLPQFSRPKWRPSPPSSPPPPWYKVTTNQGVDLGHDVIDGDAVRAYGVKPAPSIPVPASMTL